MELRQLRAFLAIAEEGSITAASRRLFIAQPAITRQLAQLERTLGCRLFDRSSRGVTLAAAGIHLLPQARRILCLADAAVDGCRDGRSSLRGRLDISSPEEGLGPLMPVVLAAYRAAHPYVEVTVHAGTRYETIKDLTHRDSPYDAALWGLNHDDERFHCASVYTEPLELMVSAESEMAATTTPIPAADALEAVYVSPTPFMRAWAHANLLGSLRNGTAPRFSTSTPFENITDCLDDIISGRALVAVSTSTERVPGTSRVPLEPDLTMHMGVITSADEQRPHVRDFAAIAAAIGKDLFTLIPGALAPAS